MKYMATYDLMETARNTNEWLGATARAMASYPAFALSTNPMVALTAAWGEVTERAFARMVRSAGRALAPARTAIVQAVAGPEYA